MTVGSSVVIGRVVAGVVIVDVGARVVNDIASLLKVDTTFKQQCKINNLFKINNNCRLKSFFISQSG
jgi:hypothetical protein